MENKELLKRVDRLLITAIMIIIATGILFISCNEPGKAETARSLDLSQQELIKRGAYPVNTSACHDCHSPKVITPHGPEPDPDRLLSGHPAELPSPEVIKETLKDWILFNQHLTSAAGPWGITFSANLTSDETGIGNWSEEQFFTAIRKGKYKGLEGSRSLLPPMPWQVYRNMNDDDLKAIFAYLKSTKPVRNIVPAPIAPDQIKYKNF